jgi:hypothetical protein
VELPRDLKPAEVAAKPPPLPEANKPVEEKK